MVIERVEFSVVPGREEAFLAHTETFRPIFESTEGCIAPQHKRHGSPGSRRRSRIS